MPQQRDPRYRGRGRRTAPPKRKPGHLRTNYTEDDFIQFSGDLYTVRSVYSDEVREADRKAARKYNYKIAAISTAIPMAFVTFFAVGMVLDHQILWWVVPVAQSVFLIYFIIVLLINKSSYSEVDYRIIIHREADRRGIKYQKDTPFYIIMNRLNADYNSHLWNRNFKWK